MLENRSFDHVLGWLATDEAFIEEGRRRYGRDFKIEGSTAERYRTVNDELIATGNTLDCSERRRRPFARLQLRGSGHSWDQGRAQRDRGFLGRGTGNDDVRGLVLRR